MLVACCSVVLLKEAHCGAMLQSDLGGACLCLCGPTVHATYAGGLGFIVKDSFARQMTGGTLVEVWQQQSSFHPRSH